MADLDVAILFWSQYCNHCNQLFAQLRGHHFDSLEMINVDTDQVKSALLEDDRLLIRYVPTLILYYQDGTVEKYEGDKVTHWFREVIRSIEPPKKRTNKCVAFPPIQTPPMVGNDLIHTVAKNQTSPLLPKTASQCSTYYYRR